MMGKAEGRAEGKAELVAIIRKKEKKGHNISDIAKALELDMVYVKEVADLIDERSCKNRFAGGGDSYQPELSISVIYSKAESD